MLVRFKFFPSFIFISLLFFSAISCQKEAALKLPSVTTDVISAKTTISAICGGTITSNGGPPVAKRGVCWSTTNKVPLYSNSKTMDGKGDGSFTSTLTGLKPNTTYYVRAYAINTGGIGGIFQTGGSSGKGGTVNT